PSSHTRWSTSSRWPIRSTRPGGSSSGSGGQKRTAGAEPNPPWAPPNAGSSPQQLARREQRDHRVAASLDRAPSAFLAIDHGEDTDHRPACLFHRTNGIQRAASRRDRILAHDDLHPRPERPFDALSGPVLLRLLPYGERIERPAGCCCGVGDGVGDGVRTECETADRIRPPAHLIERCKPEPSDQELTAAGHRRGPGVDVVVGAGAAREDEVTTAQWPDAKNRVTLLPFRIGLWHVCSPVPRYVSGGPAQVRPSAST